MRISSSSFYSSSVGGMLDQQSAMSRLNQQIASGNKLLSAADDPVAATQVMSLNDRVSLTTQYTTNLQSLSLGQSQETTVLNQLQSDLATIQKTLSGVNGSQDQNLNNSAAATIAGLYQDIKNLANYQDSSGNYIFAGFQTDTQPYSHTAIYGTSTTTSSASTYLGDNGQRFIQISQGQSVQLNDSLSSVMQVGTSSDLLQNLDQVAADLKNNAGGLQASVSTAYSVVTGAMNSLQSLQASLAARQKQVSTQQDSYTQLQATNQDALGNLTQVDQTSSIVELQMRQTSLQAAESAFASISKLSLFNYL